MEETLNDKPVVTRPASRYDWERVIRRANLPTTTKAMAMILATYAGQDGGSVHPGEDRLSRVIGMSTRNVRRHITALRSAGLLRLASRADRFRGKADEHRLTVPASQEGLAALDLLDPDEHHRSSVSGESVDNPEITGHQGPVTGSDTPDGTRGSPDTDDRVTGHPESPSPDTGVLPPTHLPTTDQPTVLTSPRFVQSASTSTTPITTDECAGGHGGAPGQLGDGSPRCAQCRRSRFLVIEGGVSA